jgi:hypothetical protein
MDGLLSITITAGAKVNRNSPEHADYVHDPQEELEIPQPT